MGGFDPSYMSGGVIGAIGSVIPHMHAAEGYRLVMTGEGTPETVAVQVVILLAFAAIFFALAARRLRFD
jgi:ABC-type multidrug transport system permease subunit